MQTDPDQLWDGEAEDGQDGPQLRATPGNQTAASGGRPQRKKLAHYIWKPEPIEPPAVDPELPKMPWPERCAEAIRYAFLRAEHWLSRQGVLREWLRLNLWVGIALLAAALLVVPPVTMLLAGAASWAGMVEAIVASITATVMALPPIVIAVGSLLIGAKLLSRSWQRRKRRPRYQQHDPNDPYA